MTRCCFVGNDFAIFLSGAGSNWYIADNTIVGATPVASGSFEGEGVDLNVTSGHTVAHNTISRVADGISSPHTNADIFGNDVFDTSDDRIELDFGRANVRVWGNRIHNAVHNGVSFQPQSRAPWYIVRNQIVGGIEAAFKFRTTDRFVLLHNTIVHWGDAWPGTSMMCCNEWDLLRAFARNNLWISVQGEQIWGFETHTRDWRTDLDYDAFDWGSSTEPFTYGGSAYPDVWSLANASGLQAQANHWANDSAYIQFDNSVTQSGTPIYRIGTTSAAEYLLEDCANCGLSGWGWQDNGYGAGVLGPPIYFAASGPQRIRIQVREDGLGIDQIVLSARDVPDLIARCAQERHHDSSALDHVFSGSEYGARYARPRSLSASASPTKRSALPSNVTDRPRRYEMFPR